jgi:hypothetical protein
MITKSESTCYNEDTKDCGNNYLSLEELGKTLERRYYSSWALINECRKQKERNVSSAYRGPEA